MNIEDQLKYNPKSGKLYWNVSKPRVKKGNEIKSKTSEGYKSIKINGKSYLQHRICWYLFYGKWPTNSVDHINGIKDDNRILNLRDVSHRENCSNAKCHRQKRKLAGTYFHKRDNVWEATIYINKRIYLGRFKTEVEANNSYKKALKEKLNVFKR